MYANKDMDIDTDMNMDMGMDKTIHICTKK